MILLGLDKLNRFYKYMILMNFVTKQNYGDAVRNTVCLNECLALSARGQCGVLTIQLR